MNEEQLKELVRQVIKEELRVEVDTMIKSPNSPFCNTDVRIYLKDEKIYPKDEKGYSWM